MKDFFGNTLDEAIKAKATHYGAVQDCFYFFTFASDKRYYLDDNCRWEIDPHPTSPDNSELKEIGVTTKNTNMKYSEIKKLVDFMHHNISVGKKSYDGVYIYDAERDCYDFCLYGIDVVLEMIYHRGGVFKLENEIKTEEK